MRTIYSIIVGALLCLIMTTTAFADELKININVESGEKATQIIGADIYALVNGKLAEITVAPDNMPFRLNSKFGALRLKSFWLTNDKAGVVKEEK